MRPVWSKRITKCLLCGDDIAPGTQRLDDTTRVNGKYRRLHYHPDCFVNYYKKWFEENVYEPTTTDGRQATLDLTEEEKSKRQKLLARLSALRSYYLPKDADPLLNLQGDISTLTPSDLRRYANFQKRWSGIIEELQQLGGLPPKYGIPLQASSNTVETKEVSSELLR